MKKIALLATYLCTMCSFTGFIHAYPSEVYIKNESETTQRFVVTVRDNLQQAFFISLAPNYFEIFDTEEGNAYAKIAVADQAGVHSFDFPQAFTGPIYLIYSPMGFRMVTNQGWNASFD